MSSVDRFTISQLAKAGVNPRGWTQPGHRSQGGMKHLRSQVVEAAGVSPA